MIPPGCFKHPENPQYGGSSQTQPSWCTTPKCVSCVAPLPSSASVSTDRDSPRGGEGLGVADIDSTDGSVTIDDEGDGAAVEVYSLALTSIRGWAIMRVNCRIFATTESRPSPSHSMRPARRLGFRAAKASTTACLSSAISEAHSTGGGCAMLVDVAALTLAVGTGTAGVALRSEQTRSVKITPPLAPTQR